MNWRLWFLLMVLLGIAGLFIFLGGGEPLGKQGEVDTDAWSTYRNEEFHFELKYPPDWQVAEFPDNQIAPIFNVFPKSVAEQPPFIHHNDVVQVSVFPYGVPTEGIFGETVDSDASFNVPVRNAIDFVLTDGSRWATFAGIENPPAPWGEAGFLFSRVTVYNLASRCERDGVPVPEAQCDQFTGDVIVREGKMDEKEWQTARAILASFRFVDENDKSDLIRVEIPEPNAVIRSPLVVRGEARGYWFFEASFPVRLFAASGRELAVVPAQAKGDWMTENFVPFEVTLIFEPGAATEGMLVFQKDNPSGLPEHDDELRISVRFVQPDGSQASGGCVITGCSAQVCAEEEVITTCEFRPEYACYTNAVCEKQQNGQCGWTQSAALAQCLRDARNS